MTARIQSLPAGSSSDPTVNAIIDFSKTGFWRHPDVRSSRPKTRASEAMPPRCLRTFSAAKAVSSSRSCSN